MKHPKLQCVCECGCHVTPLFMVLTPQKNLLCVCHCPKCMETVHTAFPLKELLNMCPKPEVTVQKLDRAIDQAISEATAKEKYEELSEADIIRLHGMMICERGD